MKFRLLKFFRGWGLTAVLFLGGGFPSLSAQSIQTNYSPFGQTNSNDRLTLGARAAAMGSAFVGIADDASALLFNPAGLSSLVHGEIGLHSDLGWVGTFQETAVFGMPTGRWGGVGLAATYFDYGTLEGRDESGSLAPSYNANRVAFQGGWGMDFLKEISLGLGLRYSQQMITGTTYSFFSPDFGLLFKPLKSLKIGLDFAYAGWGSLNGTSISIFRSGASWTEKVDASTQFLLAVGNSLEINSVDMFQAGTEVSFGSKFFLRAGYQGGLNGKGYEGFSFGGGVVLAGFVLDYAYLPYGDLGDTNRFSISYPFETSVKEPGGSSSSQEKTSKGGSKSPVKGLEKNSNDPSARASETQKKTFEKGSAVRTGQNPEVPAAASAVTVIQQENPMGSLPKIETDNHPKNQDSLSLQFEIPPDFIAKGDRFEAQGFHSEAIRSYNQAVEQDQRNVQAWWSLGKVYAELNQREYAVQCLEKALKLRPDNAPLRQWLEKYKASSP